MSLLAYIGASGLASYANVKNAEIDRHNELATTLFSLEMQDLFQARRDERSALAQEAQYQRKKVDDLEAEQRERGYKKEDFERSSAHDLNKIEIQSKQDRELEQMRQAGQERRLKERHSAALLNTGGSEKQGKPIDLEKANDQDHKRLFELTEKLNNPMTKHSPQLKGLIESEIKRLQSRIDNRLDLDGLGF